MSTRGDNKQKETKIFSFLFPFFWEPDPQVIKSTLWCQLRINFLRQQRAALSVSINQGLLQLMGRCVRTNFMELSALGNLELAILWALEIFMAGGKAQRGRGGGRAGEKAVAPSERIFPQRGKKKKEAGAITETSPPASLQIMTLWTELKKHTKERAWGWTQLFKKVLEEKAFLSSA